MVYHYISLILNSFDGTSYIFAFVINSRLFCLARVTVHAHCRFPATQTSTRASCHVYLSTSFPECWPKRELLVMHPLARVSCHELSSISFRTLIPSARASVMGISRHTYLSRKLLPILTLTPASCHAYLMISARCPPSFTLLSRASRHAYFSASFPRRLSLGSHCPL